MAVHQVEGAMAHHHRPRPKLTAETRMEMVPHRATAAGKGTAEARAITAGSTSGCTMDKTTVGRKLGVDRFCWVTQGDVEGSAGSRERRSSSERRRRQGLNVS